MTVTEPPPGAVTTCPSMAAALEAAIAGLIPGDGRLVSLDIQYGAAMATPEGPAVFTQILRSTRTLMFVQGRLEAPGGQVLATGSAVVALKSVP